MHRLRDSRRTRVPGGRTTLRKLSSHCRSVQKIARIPAETLPTWRDLRIPAVPQKQIEQELPDVLDAVRYRTTDRDRNTWYVSVSELDGNPVEIFASTAFDRDQHLQSRISNLTTITRLISLILRHVFMGEKLTLEKTLTQLHRSSRQPEDLPEMLGKVLANYSKKEPLDWIGAFRHPMNRRRKPQREPAGTRLERLSPLQHSR